MRTEENAPMRITSTFLDEITHNIPSQNWGREEWDRDFAAMKAAGLESVILIRSGYRKWITYPSLVLQARQQAHRPPVDLVECFLSLAEKHGLAFYFGTYDSGHYWETGQPEAEVELNQRVVEEVWQRYGKSPAFKGWYLSQEVSRNVLGIVDIYARLGAFCKEIAPLPVLISPYMDGRKNISSSSAAVVRDEGITLRQHEKEWNEILAGIQGAVDVVAFQDGLVDYDELYDFLVMNRQIIQRYGMGCWTNLESFDRDMPIKYLPIRWEKLRFKLEAARRAGYAEGVTFEFSHFMSPHSCYPQAHGLYRRYQEFRAGV